MTEASEAAATQADRRSLVAALRERASYLRAMVPEGLSQIERQSMDAMEDAANDLIRLEEALSTALVNLKRPEGVPHVGPMILHVLAGGSVAEYALSPPPPVSEDYLRGIEDAARVADAERTIGEQLIAQGRMRHRIAIAIRALANPTEKV